MTRAIRRSLIDWRVARISASMTLKWLRLTWIIRCELCPAVFKIQKLQLCSRLKHQFILF
ncbi:unnamed protein product, partial [Rhizoctonia solani]